MKTIITALLLTTLSQSAMAADWVNVAGDAKLRFEMDRESLLFEGAFDASPGGKYPLAKMWIRATFADSEIEHAEMLVTIDCNTRMMKRTEVAMFGKDGKNLGRKSDPSADWQAHPPSTGLGVVVNEVCAGLKQAKDGASTSTGQ